MTMAFGKKQRQIEELTAQLETATHQLDELRVVEPYLEDAKAINAEIANILATGGGHFTTSEIATRAVELVSRRRHDVIYDELADEYAAAHERELLDTLVDKARAESGETIRRKVREALAVNPSQQAKLAKRAQKAIWQEEEERLLAEVKEQQRLHIEQALARQTIFNTHNANFALNASINLAHPELCETYQDNDLLVIAHQTTQPLIYSYHSSSEGDIWWRYKQGGVQGGRFSTAMSDSLRLYNLGGVELTEKTDAHITPNKLYMDRPVYARFYIDGEEKSAALSTGSTYRGDTRELHPQQVNLFTPIAYDYYKEQLQN